MARLYFLMLKFDLDPPYFKSVYKSGTEQVLKSRSESKFG